MWSIEPPPFGRVGPSALGQNVWQRTSAPHWRPSQSPADRLRVLVALRTRVMEGASGPNSPGSPSPPTDPTKPSSLPSATTSPASNSTVSSSARPVSPRQLSLCVRPAMDLRAMGRSADALPGTTLPPPAPLSSSSTPPAAGGGGTTKRGAQPRHKVVFDLHLQHIALYDLPAPAHPNASANGATTPASSSSSASGSPPSAGTTGAHHHPGETKGDKMSTVDAPILPKPLLWQGSENRGALKFRLRRRSPLSLCLLLDESHHEMAIGVGDVTSLRLLDLDPDQQHQTDGDKTSEDGEHDMTVEGIEEMERRLRRGGMMIELGIVKGCKKEFRLREPNRYVKLSSLPGSARLARQNGQVDDGDFTGGAARITNLVRMTVHSTVTRELSASMVNMVVRELKAKDGQPVDGAPFEGPLAPFQPTERADANGANGTASDDRAREVISEFVKKGTKLPVYRLEAEDPPALGPVSTDVDVEIADRDSSGVSSAPDALHGPASVDRAYGLASHPPRLIIPTVTSENATALVRPSPPARRSTANQDVLIIDTGTRPDRTKAISPPWLTAAEQATTHSRQATFPLSTLGLGQRHQHDLTTTLSSPSWATSLPSTARHSRATSSATLVHPPSSLSPSPFGPPAALVHGGTFHPAHRSSSSLGIIGDARPARTAMTNGSTHTRAKTDTSSSLATAAARASASVDRRQLEAIFSISSAVLGAKNWPPQHWDPTSSVEGGRGGGPLEQIFGEGSFAYPSPSPMSTPSSACVSLAEESDGGAFDYARARASSFASQSVESEGEGGWYATEMGTGGGHHRGISGGGGMALGFVGGLHGSGHGPSSVWHEPHKDNSPGGLWGPSMIHPASDHARQQPAGRAPKQHLSARSSTSSLSSTNSFLDIRGAILPRTPIPPDDYDDVDGEETRPTPTPTYASYPAYTPPTQVFDLMSRRPSLPDNPANQVAFSALAPPLRPSHIDTRNQAPPSASTAAHRPPPPTQPRSTTTTSTQLPLPPSSLLPREMRERPVLPFYPVLVDPRTRERRRWVSSAGGGAVR